MARDVRVTLAFAVEDSKLNALKARIRNDIRDAVKAGLADGFKGQSLGKLTDEFGKVEGATRKASSGVKKLSADLESLSRIKPTSSSTLDKLVQESDRLTKELLEGKISAEQYANAIDKLSVSSSKAERTQGKLASETKQSAQSQRQLAKEAKDVADAMQRLSAAINTASNGTEKLTQSDANLVTGIHAKKKALESVVAEYNKLTSTQDNVGDETGELSIRIRELQTEMAELGNSIVRDELKIQEAFDRSKQALKEKADFEKNLISLGKSIAKDAAEDKVALEKNLAAEIKSIANERIALEKNLAELSKHIARDVAEDKAAIERSLAEKTKAIIKERIALERQLASQGKVLVDTVLKLARANQQLYNDTARVSDADVRAIRLIEEKKQELSELSEKYIRLSYNQNKLGDDTAETTAELARLKSAISATSNEIAKYEDDLLSAGRAAQKLTDEIKQQAAEEKQNNAQRAQNANALASEIQRLSNAQERASKGHELNKINVLQEAEAYLKDKQALRELTLEYNKNVSAQKALNVSQDTITANTAKMRGEIEKVSSAISKYEARIRSAGESGGLSGMLGSFSAAFFRVQAVILALTQISQGVQFLTQQLIEGAAVLQGRESFFTIAGTGADKLLEDVRRASSGLLAENELLKTSTALIAGTTGELREALAGSADEIVTIARAAIKVNPAISERYGGLEGVTARLVEGIRKQEVELFDEFRIIVRLGEAVKTYADENNKAASSLTLVERQQAFLNAVLEQGDVLVGQLNGDLSSQADAYTLLGTRITDVKTRMQAWLAEGLLPVVELLSGTAAQDTLDFVNTRGMNDANNIVATLTGLNARIGQFQSESNPPWWSWIIGPPGTALAINQLTQGANDFSEAIGLVLRQVRTESNGDIKRFVDLLDTIGQGTSTDVGKNFAPELARELALLTNDAEEFANAFSDLGVDISSFGEGPNGIIQFAEEIGLSELAMDSFIKKVHESSRLFANGRITQSEMFSQQTTALLDTIQTYEILSVELRKAAAETESFDRQATIVNTSLLEQEDIVQKIATLFSEQYSKSFTEATEELLKNKEGLDAWAVSAIEAAIQQKATTVQLDNLIKSLGVFTEEEIKAIRATAQFDAEVAKLIAQAGAIGSSFGLLGAQIAELAEKYGIAAIEQDKLLKGLEQASAATYQSVFKDTLNDILDSKTGMEEWVTVLRRVTDEAGLNSQQTIELANSLGLLSQSEIEAAQNAAEFESQLALVIGQAQIANPSFAGVGQQVLDLAANFHVAARAAAYFSEAQRGAFLQGFLTTGATSERNILSGFAGGLIRPSGGGGGGGAVAEKEVDAIASHFVSLLESVTKDGIDKFREEMLSTEEGLSGLEKSLFDVAIAGGASVSQIRALTDALGRGEDAAEAFRALAAEKGIESIVEQFLGGDITAEQAAEGVRLLNEQLASGQDIDLSSLGIDLTSVADGVKAVNEAVGGGGGSATQVRNWLQELVGAAEQAGAGVDTLTELARKAGYTEQEIMKSLSESLLGEAVGQLGPLAEDAGGRVAADLLAGFQQSLAGATTVEEVTAIGERFFGEIETLTLDSTEQLGTWRRALLEAGVEYGLSATDLLELAKAQDDYSESALTASLRTEAMRIQVETLVKKIKEGVPVADVLGEQAKFDSLLGQLKDAESIAMFIDNLVNGDGIKEAFDGAIGRVVGGEAITEVGKQITSLFSEKQEMEIEVDKKGIIGILTEAATNNGSGYPIHYTIDQVGLRQIIEYVFSEPFQIELNVKSDTITRDVSNAISQGITNATSMLPGLPVPQGNLPPRPSSGGSIQRRALGGPIYGPSHGEGGVNVNAEGGEYVVPRWMATPEFVAEMERVRLSNNRNVPIPSVSMISANAQMVSVPSVNNSSSTSISSSADRTMIVNNYYYGSGDTQRVARPTLTEMSGQ